MGWSDIGSYGGEIETGHTVRVRHEDQEQVFEKREAKAEPEAVTVEFPQAVCPD